MRSQWLSLDPYMRGRMSTARSYAKPTEVGEPMTAQAVGEVVESQDPRFAAGDTVVGQLGWQDYAVARGGSLRKLDPALAPRRRRSISSARPASRPTSASSTSARRSRATRSSSPRRPGPSARSSGSSPGSQAAVRSSGSRGRQKVADLTELYGYDVGINYKRDDVNARLKEACPNGVDIYFDNVGGALSETVFRRLALGARVPVCGQSRSTT